MGCEAGEERDYTPPSEDYESWSEAKLRDLESILDGMIDRIDKPKLIVLELGHFKLPTEERNLRWAYRNVAFVDRLAGKIIRRYGREIRLMATLLVNNFDECRAETSERIIAEMFADKRYIPRKSLRILSERNLKNRAYKALKRRPELAKSFIHIDGKAYLRDEEYRHDLAAGFVNSDGDIIPRCGLILTSFLDKVAEYAHVRMYPIKDFEVIFVSFSEEYHEYQRVKLGVDIYSATHSDITISPLIIHWDYEKDQSLISYRESASKIWQER